MNSTTITKYIAVTDADTAGSVTWTELQGGAHIETTRAAWAAQGLPADWLPADPTPHAALAAAVKELAGPLARPLGGRREGWLVFREVQTTDAQGRTSLDHEHAARAWIDGGELHVEGNASVCEQIRGNYGTWRQHWTSADLSSLVVGVLGRLHAVTLRSRGGNYFVPAVHMPVWRKVAAALAKHVTVQLVPALPCEDAVQAVLSGLTAEVASTVQDTFLALNGEKPLGKRALATKARNVASLADKANAYDALLGEHLVALRDKLAELDAAVAAAALLADTDTDSADGS
jgi:hypothetical protein